MFEKRKLKNCIRYYRWHQKWLGYLLEVFDINEYSYAFVGGFVKWVLDKDFSSNGPRDFDILVDIPKEDLESLLKKCNIPFKKNSFGGYKIPPDYRDTFAGKCIDVWTLDSHTVFETFVKYYGMCRSINKFCTFKNVPKTALLSIEGATYWVNKNKLYAKDCKRSLKTKHIYLTDDLAISHPSIDRKSLTAKLIRYYYEGYSLDEKCWRLIEHYFSRHDSVKVVRYMEDHYPYHSDWSQYIDEKIYPKFKYRNKENVWL